jgi:hypothetical protein
MAREQAPIAATSGRLPSNPRSRSDGMTGRSR